MNAYSLLVETTYGLSDDVVERTCKSVVVVAEDIGSACNYQLKYNQEIVNINKLGKVSETLHKV